MQFVNPNHSSSNSILATPSQPHLQDQNDHQFDQVSNSNRIRNRHFNNTSTIQSTNYTELCTQSSQEYSSSSNLTPIFLNQTNHIDSGSSFSSEVSLSPLQTTTAYPLLSTVTLAPGTIQERTLPIIYNENKSSSPYLSSKHSSSDDSSPCMTIVEQPTNRIRYRYRSEKGSHGGLNGENSTQLRKTYPSVKIHAPPSLPEKSLFVRVSLATHENPPRSHVHKLMGRHCAPDGSCTVIVHSENSTATFQNLGILFIGKKEVPDILFRRKLLRFPKDDCNIKRREALRAEAEKEAKEINLNSVRLCFEAFRLSDDALFPICLPVYSKPIANQKSPDSGELKIIRLNRFHGTVSGGDEIYLLCERVNKKEIRIRFYELDEDSQLVWEGFGTFAESDVHHQVAIVFKTPPFRDLDIPSPVQVYLQLYRAKDGEYSDPRIFIYKPKTWSSMDDPTNGCLKPEVIDSIKFENQPPSYKRRKLAAVQRHLRRKTTTLISNSELEKVKREPKDKVKENEIKRNECQQVNNETTNNPTFTVSLSENSDCTTLVASDCKTLLHQQQNPRQSLQILESSPGTSSVPSPVSNALHISSPRSPSQLSNSSTVNLNNNTSANRLTNHGNNADNDRNSMSQTSMMLAMALQQTILEPVSHHQYHEHLSPITSSNGYESSHFETVWTPPSDSSPPLLTSSSSPLSSHQHHSSQQQAHHFQSSPSLQSSPSSHHEIFSSSGTVSSPIHLTNLHSQSHLSQMQLSQTSPTQHYSMTHHHLVHYPSQHHHHNHTLTVDNTNQVGFYSIQNQQFQQFNTNFGTNYF